MTGYATDARFQEVFNLLEAWVERQYEIPVIIGDVPDPFTGDLDGQQIEIDYDQSWEDALFILAHLFGHTVQWNTDPRARELGMTPVLPNPTEAFLDALRDYEQTAGRYTLQLFHEAGVFDLDQWVTDFSAADSNYLMHFYRTGEKRPLRSFWEGGTPLLEPLPIPHFRPTRWVARSTGVVV